MYLKTKVSRHASAVSEAPTKTIRALIEIYNKQYDLTIAPYIVLLTLGSKESFLLIWYNVALGFVSTIS